MKWELVEQDPIALSGEVSPSLWDKVSARPLRNGSLAAVFLAALIAIGFYVWTLFQPPECVEYEQYGCRVIALDRTAVNEIDPELRTLTASQREILDWLRVIAIARTSDGILSLNELHDVTSRGAQWRGACTTVLECVSLDGIQDVDYDGLIGPMGLTSDGGPQSLRLASSAQASPLWVLLGRVAPGVRYDLPLGIRVDSVQLIAEEEDFVTALSAVAEVFGGEIRDTAFAFPVELTNGSISDPVPPNTVRIALVQNRRSFRARNEKVEVVIPYPGTDSAWVGSMMTSMRQIQDAAGSGLALGEIAVVAFDCEEHTPERGVVQTASGAVVTSVCAADYAVTPVEAGIDPNAKITRLVVIASRRESEIVDALYNGVAADIRQVFVARL